MQAMGGDLVDVDAPMFRPGEHFLRFLIVRLIGTGGISEVYEVKDRGRRCAIKVLQRRYAGVLRQNRRAEKEGRFLTMINHPNVIDVQEVGTAETGVHAGVFFIRMELLEGLDLREALYRIGPMSVALAGSWIRQAAYGAHQCHAVGIVHRDIKPENIFLTPPRSVKLLDLGIATTSDKRFATMETDEAKHTPIGTPLYMAPEMATGEASATPASDVYALGMTLREMVTGWHIFNPEGSTYDYWTIVRRQALGKIPLLTEDEDGIPAYLAEVIDRALSKDPRDRQPNGLAFANEVEAACKRYAAEHPDEDANPGEPAINWLVEHDDVPSFGTGPTSARRSAPGARRPTERERERERQSGHGSAVRPSAPRVAQRFHSQQLVRLDQSAMLASDPANHVVELDPDGVRITTVMLAPSKPRAYDTISLPPELRDPSCTLALAPHRRPRSKPAPVAPPQLMLAPNSALRSGPVSSASAAPNASPWIEQPNAAPTVRRGAARRPVNVRLLALPLAAFCVLVSVVVARARPASPEPLVEALQAPRVVVVQPSDAGAAPSEAGAVAIAPTASAVAVAPAASHAAVPADPPGIGAGTKLAQPPPQARLPRAPARMPSPSVGHPVDIF